MDEKVKEEEERWRKEAAAAKTKEAKLSLFIFRIRVKLIGTIVLEWGNDYPQFTIGKHPWKFQSCITDEI